MSVATAPGVRRVDAVLVTGPPLAGVTSVLSRLRDRLPARRFVEQHELAAAEAPVAVVFVVSAVAPMTESDWAATENAVSATDAVIAAVSKIDDHRHWRKVLAADRELLSRHTARFRGIPWIGVAAAPRLGEPCVDALVEAVERALRDPALVNRNNLRAWESRVHSEIAALDDEVVTARARVDALQDERERVVRAQRRAETQRAIDHRSRIARARLELTHLVRERCASRRTELRGELAAADRRALDHVTHGVRSWCTELAAEIEAETGVRLGGLAAGHGVEASDAAARRPIEVVDPPSGSRRLETQLMTVLGAGFGFGVALVLTRLITGMAPASLAVGPAVGGLAGLAVTVWVVRARALLHDRAVLDRWVGDAISAVRGALEERVAGRMLVAEVALTMSGAAADDTRSGVCRQVDARLRQALQDAAAAEAARRDRAPALRSALAAVQKAVQKGSAPEGTTDFVVTGR